MKRHDVMKPNESADLAIPYFESKLKIPRDDFHSSSASLVRLYRRYLPSSLLLVVLDMNSQNTVLFS
jgi:hypothetical protein